MTSPLRATGLLAASSAVTLVAGIVTAKVYATVVGPAGYGLYALLQSILSLAVLVAGLGIGVGLVRILAVSDLRGDASYAVVVRRAARLIGITTSAMVGLFLLAAGPRLAEILLGDRNLAGSFTLLAPAVILAVAAGIETSTLNGHRRIRALAFAGSASAVGGALASVTSVLVMGRSGIALAILGSSVVAFLTTAITVQLSARLPPTPRDVPGFITAAKALVRSGLPYTASAIAGTGAMIAVPLIVGLVVDQTAAGLYRSVAAISTAYLGFLLRAMSQEYYPRVVAAWQSPSDLPGVIDGQVRLVLALATPLILVSLAIAGPLVALLYSADFAPAVGVLHWQLAGDLLKLPAWALSFVLLAADRSANYFFLELVGGLTLVIATFAGVSTLGLPGAGVAYLITYCVYYAAAFWLVRRIAPVGLGRAQLEAVLLTVLIVLITVSALALDTAWLGPAGYGALAVAASIRALIYLAGDRLPSRWWKSTRGWLARWRQRA